MSDCLILPWTKVQIATILANSTNTVRQHLQANEHSRENRRASAEARSDCSSGLTTGTVHQHAGEVFARFYISKQSKMAVRTDS